MDGWGLGAQRHTCVCVGRGGESDLVRAGRSGEWGAWGAAKGQVRVAVGAAHRVRAPVWMEKQRCGGYVTVLPSLRNVGDSRPTVMSIMSSRRRLDDI